MKRSEQKIEDTWDLSALCRDGKEWEERYSSLSERVSDLASFQGRLGEEDNLFSFLVAMRDI